MLKCCNQCKQAKPLTDFSPQKGTRDGVMTRCKACRRAISRAKYAADPHAERTRLAEFHRLHPDARRRYGEKWVAANFEKASETKKKWLRDNPEKALAATLKWQREHPKEYSASRKRTHSKASQRASFRISNSMRARIYETLKGNKSGTTFAILGYTCADLMAHLEAQFLPGMTWENYGPVWHVDHIKPLASFSFETVNDDGFKQAWALTNLQPLWAVENIRKGARLDYQRAA